MYVNLSNQGGLLDKLFPFYIKIGKNHQVLSVGKSLNKIIKFEEGSSFSDLFEIKRPYVYANEVLNFEDLVSQLVIMNHKGPSGILMRGQIEKFLPDDSYIYFGSPWFKSIDDLIGMDLTINDFAIHDPLFDLLNALKNIEINSEEVRYLLNKVNQQKEILRKSEESHKNIINKASNIFYKANRDGIFTFVNLEGERLTQYSNAELLTMHFSELVKESHRKDTIQFYKNQVKTGTASTYFEFPIITKDGSEVWVGQSVQMVPTGPDDFELIALVIDITAQKVSEHKIRETNEKLSLFQNLIDNTQDAIQVATEEGRLFYLNEEASIRLGIQRDEVTKYFVKDFEKIFEEEGSWNRHVNELRTSKAITIEGVNVNQANGDEFPVEVTVKYVKINDTGFVIANSRDISSRKKIELRLKQQEEKYRNIIANMNIGLMEINTEGKIVYVNQSFCDISFYTPEDLVGKNSTDVFDDILFEKDVFLTGKEKKIGLRQVPVKIKPHGTRWWVVSDAPIFSDAGKHIGTIFINLDITQQKQLENELELAKIKAEEGSKAKEAFLANMSHEIRTPLNAVIGMIRELEKEKITERQMSFVKNSSIASNHLLSIINNILDISKIEAGEFSLEFMPFHVRDIINDVATIMNIKAQEKGIFIHSVVSDKVSEVLIGDPIRIQQILINIIGNAIKFTSVGGVSVHCNLIKDLGDTQYLQLVISDTGVGMDANFMSSLFKKFSQEDKSTTRRFGGTGLGMAITYELIQLMDGLIEVKSEKNVGTTFYIDLTFQKGKPEDIVDVLIPQEAVNLKGIRVLLVEDNEMNRLVAQNVLGYHDCLITEANDGTEAIELLKTRKFDVILMDIQMPIMDGIEATRVIRNELRISIPIIALTANAFKSEIDKCKSVGMNDYVIKPFDEHVLVSIISKYIDLSNGDVRKKALETPKEKSQLGMKNDKLYDLSILRNMSHGNEQFIQKMIQLFVEQTSESIIGIKNAYQTNDIDTVYKLAHRMKPSIDNMGIGTLRNEIRQLEKLAKDQIFSEEVEGLIQLLERICNNVIEQLQADISN